MRIAALYDIHGNLPALEAVLSEVEAERVDLVIVGGDVVAGPLPFATLRALRDLPVPTRFIRGNAESEVLRAASGQAPGSFSKRADDEAYWVAATLSPDDLRFIESWPMTVELEVEPHGRVLFCHATPDSDTRVFTDRSPEAVVQSLFRGVGAGLVVCGHTHLPFDRAVGSARVVNAGSIGMPFGQPGADWLLLGERIAPRHTMYDLEAAAERVRRSDYPHAESFARGSILSVPGVELAFQMLGGLESRQGSP